MASMMMRRSTGPAAEPTAPRSSGASAVRWHADKLGNGISLDASLATISRHAPSGWGTQLAETWYGSMSPEDQATIVLQLGELGDNAFIGMVDHNFYPAPWDTPLNQSLHFSGIETATGNAYEKTVRSIQKLSSMGKGTRLRITIDVPQRELKIEQLKEGSDEARYAVNLSLVGQRVCLAVCFGPGQSMATLQAVDGSKAQVLLGNKQVSDLWDPENVVKPPALGSARTAEEEAKQKVRENQARTAELLEK